MNVEKVCVYCASSRQCDPAYHEAAHELGKELAAHNVTIVYGGGLVGSMGALANAALADGGRVIGILPQFMHELEWGHTSLSELIIVNDIHERKRLMISDVDAVIALPGGCGTLEELFEAITWKRLGLYSGPIVMVNTMNFFAPCIELLNHCIDQRFMDPRHAAMWSVVDRPADVVEAIGQAPPWRPEYRSFAGL
ncbi:MAG TPA: TIGR00730 family Rossman fold protein [Candidatus Binataceae bacterium]|jgi:uncharacterized protein (TIGR00730 family)|nr:TIGR00730 family Rossman fold protein [Candidatus Binataceae bacterium]